jgi:hypothetical protein
MPTPFHLAPVVLQPVPTFPLVVSIPSKQRIYNASSLGLQIVIILIVVIIMLLYYTLKNTLTVQPILSVKWSYVKERLPCFPRLNAALNRLLVTPFLSCSVE